MTALENRAIATEVLGTVPYVEAWDRQREYVTEMASGIRPETLLLLEHPHTFTIGRTGGRDHILASEAELERRGAVVLETDRGGDITYHGPGQLVGYPLLNLRAMGGDVHRYLRNIEESIIRLLAEYGLRGNREPEYTGVWCMEAKVAAIGVKVSRGITMHGFALNVTTDLTYFDMIVPCGIEGRSVTSLERLLGRSVPMNEVIEVYKYTFASVFGT